MSAEADFRKPKHCRLCGQRFRPSCRRSSNSEFGGLEYLCDWCHIQDYRASEIFDDPLDWEADVRAKILARRGALNAGWRFECERIAPRKQRYHVRIIRPDGVAAETLGAPAGFSKLEAQEAGRDRIVFLARTS